MIKCSQCSNPAIYQVEGHYLYLCLNCYERIMRIHQQEQANHASMINFLLDEMDEITGVSSYSRVRMPQPIVHQGNTIHNFINIDRSVVGAVNTGRINALNQSMNNISNQVNPEIATLLSSFIEAMLKSQAIDKTIKEELLEEVAFLSEQLLAEKSFQKKNIVKRTMESIETKIATIGTLFTIWQTINPILKPLFGL